MAVPGIVLPVSGPYVGTWDGFPLGVMNDDGYELACTFAGQEVNETDAFGMTLVEAIYRGMNWRCRFRGLEWDRTGLLNLGQQFGTTQPATPTNISPILFSIGERWTGFCQPLVLTAILGNPPSVPLSLTALSAGFAPNSQSAFLMTSKVREWPFEMVLLPYQDADTIVPFTTT